MNENENKKQGLELELSPEIGLGEYVNFALPGLPKSVVRSRVIMAPEHAKRLLGALQENIMRYERTYGAIKIPNQEPRTIAPFGPNKGEA